jgi:hypothetical protein
MDDALGKLKVIPDHFKASTTSVDSHQNRTSSVSQQSDDSWRYFILLDKILETKQRTLRFLVHNDLVLSIWFSIGLIAGLEKN